MKTWTARAEGPVDIETVRSILLAAFPGPAEADLVDALRSDPAAWIPGLSIVAERDQGPEGYALLSRCTVGGHAALALGPCAVRPEQQRSGAGCAAIRGAIEAARARADENLVVVLGHPAYYPRFGFTPAADAGVGVAFDAPPEALMVLALDPARPVPTGLVEYSAAFGV